MPRYSQDSDPRYVQVPVGLLLDPEVDSTTVAVYAALRSAVGARLNDREAAKLAGCNERTLRKRRDVLCRRGWCTRINEGYVLHSTRAEPELAESEQPAKPAAKKKPVPKPPKPPAEKTWQNLACELWTEHMGGTPPGGRIANGLKPLVKQYGEAEILRYWNLYLTRAIEQGRTAFANPQDFAAKYEHHKASGGIVTNGSARRTTDPQHYGEGTKEVKWKS